MSDREQDGSTRGSANSTRDTEQALQDELRREAGEGRGGVGDVSSNRNLSGSSTWETIVDQASDGSGERGEVM